ncbi:hypothetical protein SAMN05421688_2947 [Poseidonocella pacifica]|uniref:Membrane-anchored ribosome-binding protein, inhibits growth in stationary phase, ElaB/YqjD/DUF883 family n=1 Tax=Poseidonocella pacifica TaxID=871651 RepID=A0A1I0YFK9_9RHOB|nr:hypothetical protein [Poseidonocella pacifica]SFB11168.1 hypothetical protein SAMN05421688_2947 [Poseidonocella pacifica]
MADSNTPTITETEAAQTRTGGVKENAKLVADKANVLGHEVQDAAVAQFERAKEATSVAVDTGSEFVRKNPGLAIAGAVGFGLLLGLALRDRY